MDNLRERVKSLSLLKKCDMLNALEKLGGYIQ